MSEIRHKVIKKLLLPKTLPIIYYILRLQQYCFWQNQINF